MKLNIYAFSSFPLRYILWTTKHSLVLCRPLNSLLFYFDVNRFCAFHIVIPDSFFTEYSAKEPLMSSIHKQCITNDIWISRTLVFVVSFAPVGMRCSGNLIMTGKVMIDRSDPLHYYHTEISTSDFPCSFWKINYCASPD